MLVPLNRSMPLPKKPRLGRGTNTCLTPFLARLSLTALCCRQRTHHGGTYLCEYDPTCKFDHPFAVTQGFGKSFGCKRSRSLPLLFFFRFLGQSGRTDNRLEEVHTGKWCDWNLEYGVRCHNNIAAVWVAFFSRQQRYCC